LGGLGSGRRSAGSAKRTTDGLPEIDIRRWLKQGRLIPGAYFDLSWQSQEGEKLVVRVQVGLRKIVCGEPPPILDGVRLQYSLTAPGADSQTIDEAVKIISTPCHFGGARRWFECPGPSCDSRRVATLFLADRFFHCRKCCGLAYSSERAGTAGRALGRLRKIRRRLGASENAALFSPLPPKPKRMRHATYLRLRQQAEVAEMERLVAEIQSARALEHVMKRRFVDWVPHISRQDPPAEALLLKELKERAALERASLKEKQSIKRTTTWSSR
jgi:hypothetical protein